MILPERYGQQYKVENIELEVIMLCWLWLVPTYNDVIQCRRNNIEFIFQRQVYISWTNPRTHAVIERPCSVSENHGPTVACAYW